MDQHDIHNLKEEERKSAEHHSASYDASASPSLSGDDDERRLDVEGGDDQHSEDVEVDDAKTPEEHHIRCSVDYETDEGHPDDNDDNQVSTTTSHKEDEASHLLLNFSQQSFTSSSEQSRIQCLTSSTESGKDSDPNVSTTTTSHLVTPVILSSAFSSIDSHPSASSSEVNASFCRPPGLGPAAFCTPTTGQSAALVCPICGFSCNSKFHYNSHMNTHGDHQCSMCDYTSRTEGRLKKHMRESHTVEEQLAVGLEIKPSTPVPSSSASTSLVSTTSKSSSSCLAEMANLSTTMASLVDVANMAAAAVAVKQETPSSLATALSMENLVSTSGFLSTIASTALPSALDQIRAFAENSALLPDSGTTLVNAFGAMSNEVMDFEKSPEKFNNAEPRRNSNGKMKQYKCKQCPHISFSKDDQWAHARTHIPVDKQMNCPTCNFVTEYKHHLEYHIRNHIGSKPFQCKKCSYTCVNKSMLNSHMKSHTNVYQFRCMDCTYATKYCHSLKLHLKKYDHRRVPDGMEMGDTSPTQVKPEPLVPYPNFGMKLEVQSPATTLAQTLGLSPIVTSQSLNYASQMLLRQHQMEQMSSLISGLPPLPQPLACAVCDFKTSSQEELMRHNVNHFLNQSNQSPIVSLYQSLPQMNSFVPQIEAVAEQPVTADTQEERDSGHVGDDEMEGSTGSTGSPHCSSKGSGDETEQPGRKIKAFKLDQISQRLQGKSPNGSEDSEDKDTVEENPKMSVSPAPETPTVAVSTTVVKSIGQPFTPFGGDDNLNLFQRAYLAQLNALSMRREEVSWRFQCHHCRMAFQDQALYHIHMGYHGYEHVFKCNRCGHIAPDSLNFNLHLLQASHE